MGKRCDNCGAPDGLHHYKTNQCPYRGREAPVGQKQVWLDTVFDTSRSEIIDLSNRITQLESALAALIDAGEDCYSRIYDSESCGDAATYEYWREQRNKARALLGGK